MMKNLPDFVTTRTGYKVFVTSFVTSTALLELAQFMRDLVKIADL